MGINYRAQIPKDFLLFVFDPIDPKCSNSGSEPYIDRVLNKTGIEEGTNPIISGDSYLEFDGTNYIRFNDMPHLQFTNSDAFSVCCWVKPTAASQNFKGLFGNSVNNGGGWQLSFLNGNYHFLIGGPTTSYPFITSSVVNQWIFLTITFDQTDLRTYYDTTVGPTYTRSITTNSNPIFIGNGTQGGWGTSEAQIGQMLVFSKALSQKEITSLYESTKGRFGL